MQGAPPKVPKNITSSSPFIDFVKLFCYNHLWEMII